MMAAPKTVDAYLASTPEPQRSALEKVRAAIKAAAPDATETISYGIPTFRYHGRMLLSVAAFRDHCSLYPMNESFLKTHAIRLSGGARLAGKGTLQFSPSRPLPDTLVRKIVRGYIAEIDANERQRAARRGRATKARR